MRGLSPEFMQAFKAGGHLNPLLCRVQADLDLEMFIRNEYVNIYYKGASLLKLNGPQKGYVAELHAKYLNDPKAIPVVPVSHLDNPQHVRNFINKIPLLKENIGRVEKKLIEAEFKQLFVRCNNRHGELNSVTSEFYVVDFEYTLSGRKDQIDLVALHWPRDGRNHNRRAQLVLVEAKYGLNKDIAKLHDQITRYSIFAKNHWDEFISDLRRILQQRAELGLFARESKAVGTLEINDSLEDLELLALLMDYNPSSSTLDMSDMAKLCKDPRVQLVRCGLALWDKAMHKNGIDLGD